MISITRKPLIFSFLLVCILSLADASLLHAQRKGFGQGRSSSGSRTSSGSRSSSESGRSKRAQGLSTPQTRKSSPARRTQRAVAPRRSSSTSGSRSSSKRSSGTKSSSRTGRSARSRGALPALPQPKARQRTLPSSSRNSSNYRTPRSQQSEGGARRSATNNQRENSSSSLKSGRYQRGNDPLLFARNFGKHTNSGSGFEYQKRSSFGPSMRTAFRRDVPQRNGMRKSGRTSNFVFGWTNRYAYQPRYSYHSAYSSSHYASNYASGGLSFYYRSGSKDFGLSFHSHYSTYDYSYPSYYYRPSSYYYTPRSSLCVSLPVKSGYGGYSKSLAVRTYISSKPRGVKSYSHPSIYCDWSYHLPSYTWNHGRHVYRCTPTYGYHYRSFRQKIYRCTRPYYYFAPSWYGWEYQPGLGYLSQRVDYLEEVVSEQAEELEQSRASAYQDKRKRTPLNFQTSSEKAHQEAEKNELLFEENFEDLMAEGAAFFSIGDYDSARKRFKQALILEPFDSYAKLGLGHSAFASGNYQLASFALRRAVTESSETLQEQGNPQDYYSDHFFFEVQYRSLEQALEDDPQDSSLHFLVGYYAFFSEDYQKSAQALEKLLRLNPDDLAAQRLYQALLDSLEKNS